MAALERGLAAGHGGLGLALQGSSARGGRPGPVPPARCGPPPLGHEQGLAAAAASTNGPPPSLRPSGGPRRKHKMDAEPEDCPASKKRLTEGVAAASGLCPATPALESWVLQATQPAGGTPLAPQSLGAGLHAPGLLELTCEEMEQAVGDQQCEAARRKLQEIEARITDEDEDEEDGLVEAPLGNLPTLVLSDTLKTGLKRDYTENLTKKIIESMSRPSMELVVWKPLPEFLTKKAKSVPAKNYKPMAERCSEKPATLEAALCLQPGEFSQLQQTEMPSAFYSSVEPAGCSEEEMEL